MAVEYTEDRKRAFKEQFSARRKRQLLVAAPLIVMIGVLAFSEGRAEILGIPFQVVAFAFFGLVVAALLFSLRNWRCPACDRYLGKSVSVKFCPRCGVELSQQAARPVACRRVGTGIGLPRQSGR